MASREAHAAEGARRPRRRPDPRRSHKAALGIAQDIVDDITRDDLGPGAKLPGEREMLERFGAGRGTLRESLRFLEMTGAITLKPGPRGGPVVAEQDGQDLAWVLGLFMQLRGVPFGAVVTARETLEPELAGLAAERATAEDHARIKDTIDGMSAFLDDEQNFLAENDRFHAAVAAAAGNDLFALVISSLHTITDGVPLGLDYARPRRENVVKSHTEILEAIEAGDAEGARWAMRKHLRRFRTRVESDFPAVLDRPLRWRDIVP
ncbi:FadR/GntR family transcriptional regulator [Amycolatopsis sp. NPDC003865]